MGAFFTGYAHRAWRILVLVALSLAFAASTDSLAQSGRLLQIATRGQVLTGDDVMIAGFIVGGSAPKTVVITVQGSSLASVIARPLRDSTITLYRQSDLTLLKTNDNWHIQDIPSDVQAIEATGFQPSDGLEPAIIATLAPGAYTAVVRGAGDSTGVGVVAVFEVDHPEVPLINISTRGRVLTGENVLIAGFAVGPSNPAVVVVRGTGPSLPGILREPLQNPTLTLVRMSDRTVIATNDDWQVQANPADVAALQASGLQPLDPREPAIIATLPPGNYTAIVSGVGTTTGLALVEVFRASFDVAITSANNTTFTVATAGTFIVTTAGTPAATSVTATGALPTGVTFTPGTTTGTLSGTPAAGTGGTYNLTITASNGGVTANGTQSFTLTVNQPPAITSVNNATFQVGSANTHTVVANGFPVPALSVTGALPGGVTFNPATGALSGTPAAGTAGSYPLTFTAANGVGSNAAQNFTLTVNETVAITSANAATFVVGTAGTFTITTSATPTATSITTTALPAGLSLSATVGGSATISGTPTGSGGTFPITITASNGGVTPNGTQSFTLTVNQAPAITSANNATFAIGSPNTFNVTASGFPAAMTFTTASALPSGVTLSAAGVLSGTPAAGTGGTYPITITAANGVAPNATQSFTLNVNQAPTITSANATSFTVGLPGTFTATATGFPAAMTFTTANALPGGVTLSAGGVLSGTPAAGSAAAYPITITASNGVAPAGTQNFTLTVVSQSQTISFTSVAPASPVANGPTYNVTATATSGLTVALTIDASAGSVCTIAGSTVTFIAGGTCVINANQAGNGTFSPAPQVQQSMVVAKATQTVTITSVAPGAAVVAGPTYNVVANAAPSGLPVTFSTSTPAVCTAAGSTISFVGAGSCTVVATQVGNATYNPASANQTFAVGMASQTISFTSVAPVPASVGGPTYGVTATATSTLPVAFTIDPAAAAVCTIAGSTVSFIGVGNCIINANQAGNANYNAAPQVQQTFAVKNSQTITITSAAPANPVVGGNYTVTATATSGLGVVFTSGSPGVCTNAGALFSFIAVGTCVINANQPGDANYFAAPQVQQSFAVNQVPAITSANNTSFNVGTFGTFTVTTTGFPTPALSESGALPSGVSFLDNGNGTAALSGTPAAGTAAGSPYAITITANNGVPPNATQGFTLTVTDAAIAVDDSYSVLHDSGVNAMAPSLLANDTGTPAPAVTSVTGATTCTVFPCSINTTNGAAIVVQSNGNFTYAPAANYAGADSFAYIATNVAGSDPATATITVTNALPVVDLSGGAVAGIDFAATFTEGGGFTPIVDPAALTVTDADDTHLTGATIVITNLLDGLSEGLNVTCPDPGPGCSGLIQQSHVSYNPVSGTLEILTPAGATLADYQVLLRTLRYANASASPNVTPRDVTVTINDGISDNNPIAHAIVTIAAVNNAPVLAAIEGAALAYTVGGPAAAITSSLTVTDADSAALASATVQITANCNSADDVLAFTPQAGITGSYASGSCLLTLSGSSSPVNYQAALRSVTYQNTNQATSTLTRTVSFRADDGAAANNLSNIATRNINVLVNTAPTLTAGGTLNYTENQAPTAIDATITVVDGDSANLVGATAQITGNCAPAEDVLAFTTQNGITGSYLAGTCTMTLTGSSSVANYQTALRTVQYSNSSESPTTTARTVTWRVNDGAPVNNLSNTPTSTITVAATNDAPVLTAGATLAYTENDPAAVIDATVTVNDVDSTTLTGATVRITANCTNPQDVLAFSTQNGITAVYTAATCLMTLSGTTTLANYQTALRSITYANTSENPITAARTVTWIATDGTTPSTGVTSTIAVTAVNDAPTLALVGSLAYTENQAAASLITSATITDVDSTNMSGATAQITANYVNGQDVLSYVTALGITGSFNAGSGTLTLTGTTTIANYQTALANVKYANTSENPSTLTRTVTWQVNDGGAASNLSNQPTSTITVTAVNDPPVANAATVNALAGIPVTYAAGTLGGSDPGEGTAVSINTGSPASLTSLQSVTLNANGSFTVTPTPGFSGAASFTYTVTDSGSPGPGVASAPATVTVNVNGPATHFVTFSGAATAACGNLDNPCTLAQAGTNIAAATGRQIFIADGNTHTANVVLNASAKLFGQGVTGADFATVLGYNTAIGLLPAGATFGPLPAISAARPTVIAVAGTTLTVGANNTLRGFNLQGAGRGLLGNAFGTLTLGEMLINTIGQAIDLTTGTLAATLDSVTSAGSTTSNILLSAVQTSGTVAFGTGTLSGAPGASIYIGGQNGSFTYGGQINSTAALAVFIENKTGGGVTLSGNINPSVSGGGFLIRNNNTGANTFTFSGGTKKISTGGNAGIDLSNNTGATISFTGGGLTIATTSGTGFDANGGAAAVNVTGSGNTISSGTGTAVNVVSTTIGGSGLNFQSVSSNGGATGIVLNNTGSGAFTVTGTGGAGSGGTIQNKTGRGASFITAQNISLTNMNFTSTATSDLDADNSGLTTGDNLVTNAAIHLQYVTNATLDGIAINGSAEQGINGHFVTNFALRNSSIVNAGNGPDEDGIHFYNMLGTSEITNTTITSSGDDNINIQNNTPGAHCAPATCPAFPAGMTPATTLNITGGSANTGVLGSGYLMGIRGTSNTTVTVNGVTANNNFSGGIVIDTYDTATSSIEITGVTSTNNNDAISLSSKDGNTKFDIHDNVSFAGTDFGRINILKAAFSTGGTLQGKIRNNPIVVTDGQTADGVFIFQAGDGTLTVAITNNTFTYRGTQRAINVQGGQDGSGQLNATITGNTIDMQVDGTGNAFTGIFAQTAVASPSGDNTNMCADIGGAGGLANVFTHSLGNNMPAGDIRTRQRFVTTVTLPGYAGAVNDNAAVVAYLAGRNTLVNSPTATATNENGITPGAGGYIGGGACAQPVFP